MPVPAGELLRSREVSAGEKAAHARLSLLALGAYAIVLAASIHSVGASSASYWVAVLAVLLITAVAVLASRLPLAFYGLTWRGWRRSLGSAAISTALLAAAGLGFLLVSAGPLSRGSASSLFSGAEEMELLVYVVLAAPLQELVFRGVFQSSARHILGDGRRAAVLTVAISAAAYAASHLPWGLATALVMLVPGIVWGIQFERDRTLLGVMLSHALIGYLFVGATPLWKLITSVR